MSKWEVRIAGPDDVLTFDSVIEAHRYAQGINAVADHANARLPASKRVLCHATVHMVGGDDAPPTREEG